VVCRRDGICPGYATPFLVFDVEGAEGVFLAQDPFDVLAIGDFCSVFFCLRLDRIPDAPPVFTSHDALIGRDEETVLMFGFTLLAAAFHG